MAGLNDSHSGFSPTVADNLSASSRMLSASISSLSSSTSSARHSSSHISKTYRQASTLFLTRRLPEALSTILPLITPPTSEDDNGPSTEPAPVATSSRTTRIKVWSLYLTILNAIVELDPDDGKDAFGTQEWRAICSKVREGEVWEEVVRNGYHGVEGDVDSDVVINLATLLLAHARTQTLNQKRLESYLAAATIPNLDLSDRFSSPAPNRHRSPTKNRPAAASGTATPRDLASRVKILELYTLHVLLRNDEWDYAREFIASSAVLDEERREAFLAALQSLAEERAAEAERRERDEAERRERDEAERLEEARRLRAAEARKEERRVAEEEERARRAKARVDAGGSEVDYGVEGTPGSVAGSSQGRRGKGKAAAAGARGPLSAATPKAGKAVAARPPAPSLVGRAAIVLGNVRALIEQLGASLAGNPVLLMRTLAFIVGLLVVLGRKNIRERVARVLGSGWGKVKATAGMGVKVSYI